MGVGFPAAGKADIYDDFLALDAEQQPGFVHVAGHTRVVISPGVRDGGHDLDGWEVAGALVAQIQAVIDERYRQLKGVAASVGQHQRQETVDATRLARPAASSEQQPTTTTTGQEAQGGTEVPSTSSVGTRMASEAPTLAELLATVQQGQPLVAAGPSSNVPTRRSAPRNGLLAQASSARS